MSFLCGNFLAWPLNCILATKYPSGENWAPRSHAWPGAQSAHAPVASSMETEVPPLKCSTPLFLPLPLWIVTFLPLFLPLFSPRQVSSSSWCPFRPQGREHSPDHEGIHQTKKWADQAWWLPCVSGLCSLQTQGLSFFLKHSDETYHSEFSYVDT